jgi:hypothetical protein
MQQVKKKFFIRKN